MESRGGVDDGLGWRSSLGSTSVQNSLSWFESDATSSNSRFANVNLHRRINSPSGDSRLNSTARSGLA